MLETFSHKLRSSAALALMPVMIFSGPAELEAGTGDRIKANKISSGNLFKAAPKTEKQLITEAFEWGLINDLDKDWLLYQVYYTFPKIKQQEIEEAKLEKRKPIKTILLTSNMLETLIKVNKNIQILVDKDLMTKKQIERLKDAVDLRTLGCIESFPHEQRYAFKFYWFVDKLESFARRASDPTLTKQEIEELKVLIQSTIEKGNNL